MSCCTVTAHMWNVLLDQVFFEAGNHWMYLENSEKFNQLILVRGNVNSCKSSKIVAVILHHCASAPQDFAKNTFVNVSKVLTL